MSGHGLSIPRIVRSGISLIALMPLAGVGTAAHAQNAGGASNIEEIIVTARRVEEKAQDVPIAIAAFSQRELETRAIRQTSDLMSSVPGVFIAAGANRGNNSPIISIRGQLNRDPGLTADPSVGLYFGEVPWAHPGGSNVAFLDLQSVEVLKGPQGTLFGRNTTAGAILLTPNSPTDTLGARVKLTAGDYRLLGAEAMVNLPVGETLAFRFAGAVKRRDGYLTVANSGEKVSDLNYQTARLSARWQPSNTFSSTFIANYINSDSKGDNYKLYGISPVAPSAAANTNYQRFKALLANDTTGRYEVLSAFAPGVVGTRVSGVPSSLLSYHYARVETWSVQNSSTLDLGTAGMLGDVRIKNIISYRKERDGNTHEGVAAPFLTSQSLGAAHARQFTEELQLQGKTENLTYVVGAFYFQEKGVDRSDGYVETPVLFITDDYVKNTSYSVFGHFDYDLSSLGVPVTVSGGVRLNKDRRFIEYRTRRGTTPGQGNVNFTCLTQPTLPANNGSLCHLPLETRFSEVTWDAGLSYKPIENSMIYATVSRGYRAGGYNLNASSPNATTPFKPEFVTNFEIGAKNDFDIGGTSVRLNLAGFYSKYKDIQRTVQYIVNGISFGNITTNAAQANIKGGEAELTIKPTRHLQFGATYSHIKPKYKEFIDQYREPTNGLFYPVDVSDSEFILASRTSIGANVNYTLPVPETLGEITLTATYYHRTSFQTTSDINTAHCAVPGDPNPAAIYVNCYNRAGKLPGYGLLNLRADWRNVAESSLDLGLFVTNATNKYYFTNSLNSLASRGANSVLVGEPRMFGLELTYSFGGK